MDYGPSVSRYSDAESSAVILPLFGYIESGTTTDNTR
jgi:hypothetical protein